MKVKVNKDACIGCGACHQICDKVFDFGDDGYAYAKVEDFTEDIKDDVQEAADSCPTGAILVED